MKFTKNKMTKSWKTKYKDGKIDFLSHVPVCMNEPAGECPT